MIKRAAPFLIAFLMFLTASCGTSAPLNSYVADMQPTMEQLAKWQVHYTNFEALLTDPGAIPNGMSRLDMIELYNMATGYKITREDYVSMGFSPLDLLVGEANKVATEGRSIEQILSASTPDDEIKASHETVLKCVQTRAAFVEGLSAAIRDLVPVDLSGDASACNTFDADLAKLTAYVNEN
jgi:hypothetical protein